jgi:hypothetical protein
MQVDAGAGPSTTEARQRLVQYGPNEPVALRRTSGLVQILLLFINPLAIILLVASAISEAIINGETVSAKRPVDISAGYLCTWTVTEPQRARVTTEWVITLSEDRDETSQWALFSQPARGMPGTEQRWQRKEAAL